MAFVTCNAGEKLLLEAAVGKVAAGNLKLKLFKNDVTPGHSDTTATYTEADFTATRPSRSRRSRGTPV